MDKRYRLGLYEKAMPNSLSLPEKLALAKSCGFDFVEISIDETEEKLARLKFSDEQRGALKKAINDSGIGFASICLSAHRKYPLGGGEERNLEIMRDAIGLAQDLDISLIQLAGYDVYYTPSTEETRARFLCNLKRCTAMAAEGGITLAFETMETPFMDTVEKAMAYVREVESPWLKLYPDLGNLTNAARLYGVPVLDDLRLGNGHMAALHLKESAPGIYRDRPYGTGHVDFPAAVNAALHMGVNQFVGEFWHDGVTEPKEYVLSAKAFLDTQFEKAGAK